MKDNLNLQTIISDFIPDQATILNEFIIKYQAVINSTNGDILALETLIEWFPEDFPSQIPYKLFIREAKRYKILRKVTALLMAAIFRQNKKWQETRRQNHTLVCTLPHEMIFEDCFIQLISKVSEYTGFPLSSFAIKLHNEIFTTTSNYQLPISNLRKMGIKICVSGSNLFELTTNELKKTGADILEINSKLIRNIEDQNYWDKIIAMIQTAQLLDKKVYAAGITKHRQVMYLEKAGCNIMRGNLWLPPTENFPTWTIPKT